MSRRRLSLDERTSGSCFANRAGDLRARLEGGTAGAVRHAEWFWSAGRAV